MRALDSLKNEIRVFDHFPHLVVEFIGAPDDAEFAAYIAKVEASADRGAARGLAPTRTVVLFDTTHATRPVTASQRRMQAEHMRRMKIKAQSNGTMDAWVGVCFVLSNPVLRGVLTAVLWLQPMSQRYEVCATRREADAWCRQWVLSPVAEAALRARG